MRPYYEIPECLVNGQLRKSKSPFPISPFLRSTFHPYDYKIWYEPVVGLAKSKKDAMAMYKPEHPGTPTAKEHVKWAYEKMPNENWSLWTVRHHRNKPEDFTPEVKTELEHYTGMLHLPEVAEVRFNKEHDLPTGLGMLRDAEAKGIENLQDRFHFAPTPKDAKRLLDCGDGYSWWDLGKPHDRDEGDAMGHCGNTGSPHFGDSVLSLRKEHLVGDKRFYEPHLTFIKNGQVLGEMKGRGNERPAKHYHPHIVKLLSTGLAPIGGGYAPEKNFAIEDLSPEHLAELAGSQPAIAAMHSAVPELSPEHYATLQNMKASDYRKMASLGRTVSDDPPLVLSVVDATLDKLKLPLSVQHEIASGNDNGRKIHLAKNPNVLPQVQIALSNHPLTVQWLLKNPAFSNELAVHLSTQNQNPVAQGMLARSPNNKSLEAQHNLALRDSFWPDLARNRSTHLEVVRKIGHDSLSAVMANAGRGIQVTAGLPYLDTWDRARDRLHDDPSFDEECFKVLKPFEKTMGSGGRADGLPDHMAALKTLVKETGSLDIQNQLVESTNPNTISALTFNRDLHPEVQRKLVKSPMPLSPNSSVAGEEVAEYLCDHKTLTDEDAMREVAKSKHVRILASLARLDKIPEDVQLVLASNPSHGVASGLLAPTVARCQRSLAVLSRLADHPYQEIRARTLARAYRDLTPEECAPLAIKLADDKDAEVRHHVAASPMAVRVPGVLLSLASHLGEGGWEDAHQAQHTFHEMARLAPEGGIDESVQKKMVEYLKNTPATPPYDGIVGFLNRKELTPETIRGTYEVLEGDPQADRRMELGRLALAPACPNDVLRALLSRRHGREYVMRQVAKRPNLPPELAHVIIDNRDLQTEEATFELAERSKDAGVLKRLASIRDSEIRRLLLFRAEELKTIDPEIERILAANAASPGRYSDLNKAAGLPKLSGILSGKPSTQVDIIDDPQKIETRFRLMHDAHVSRNVPKDSPQREKLRDGLEENVAGLKTGLLPAYGATSLDIKRPVTFAAGPNIAAREPNAVRGTQAHESLHLLFNAVEKEHGPEGRLNLASNLLNSLPDNLRVRLDHMQDYLGAGMYLHSPRKDEETIARVYNYLNSSHTRDTYRENVAANGGDPMEADREVKAAHRALLNTAAAVTRQWLQKGEFELHELGGKAALSLAKALEPTDFHRILKASTPKGRDTVDDSKEKNSHPQAVSPDFEEWNKIVAHPDLHPRHTKKLGDGITQKVLYKSESKTYMVKPYHEGIVKRIERWQRFPIQGWAEMTNQDLYHAAGLGNNHQKVTVTRHDMEQRSTPGRMSWLTYNRLRSQLDYDRPNDNEDEWNIELAQRLKDWKAAHATPGKKANDPALVISLEPGVRSAVETMKVLNRYSPHGRDPKPPLNEESTRRIAVMDFLSNNLDRHMGNILYRANGEPLAVDHSRSFQYCNIPSAKHAMNRRAVDAMGRQGVMLEDQFGSYVNLSALRNFLPAGQGWSTHSYDNDPSRWHRHQWTPTINEWWPTVRNGVVEAMDKRLLMLKDTHVAAHIRRNFHARVDWLDERAKFGLENYGDYWYKNGAEWHPPGRKVD